MQLVLAKWMNMRIIKAHKNLVLRGPIFIVSIIYPFDHV